MATQPTQYYEWTARQIWAEHNAPSLMQQCHLSHLQAIEVLLRAWHSLDPETKKWWRGVAGYRIRDGTAGGGRFFPNQPALASIPWHNAYAIQPEGNGGDNNAQEADSQGCDDESDINMLVRLHPTSSSMIQTKNQAPHDSAQEGNGRSVDKSGDISASINEAKYSKHEDTAPLSYDRPVTEAGLPVELLKAVPTKFGVKLESEGNAFHTRASELLGETQLITPKTIVSESPTAPFAETGDTQADHGTEGLAGATDFARDIKSPNRDHNRPSARLLNQQRRRERLVAQRLAGRLEDSADHRGEAETTTVSEFRPETQSLIPEEARRRWNEIAAPNRLRFLRAIAEREAVAARR